MRDRPAIEVADLVVRYGDVEALGGIDLSITRGQSVALIGPNGGGKSSLLKALVGLITPLAGEVRLDAGLRGAELAYVPQRDGFNWQYPATVWDVVALGRAGRRGWLGRLRRDDRECCERSIAEAGLGGLEGRPMDQLSGGQRQRMVLARALAQEPRLLVLDECLQGVDAASTGEMLRLLRQRVDRDGLTIVAATHDLATLELLFDRVVAIDRRVVADASPTALGVTGLAAAVTGLAGSPV